MSFSVEWVRRLQTIAGRIVGWAMIAAAVGSGLVVVRRLDARPRTDDAIVTANTIEVVPEVVGRIASLNVHDDQVVHKGDVLFTIEPEVYSLRLTQARASVLAIEHQIELGDRVVASQVTGVSAARTTIESARARLKAASDTLDRLEPLLAKGFVTAEQVDLARTAKLTAEAHLTESSFMAQQARQLVGDTHALRAQLDGARTLVTMAERDLQNTTVRAPFDGRIVGVKTSIGQFVSLVRPLFTLLDTSRWYIVASFRETELESIRAGEKVTAYVMAKPREHLDGTVESIGSAVTTMDDITIAGVPHVFATLNWVKIAQRFPVRIALENPPEEIMRIGASAVVVIHHDAH